MASFLSALFSSPSASTSNPTPRSTSRTSLPNPSVSTSDTNTRQCWICFAEESVATVKSSEWVRPCLCHGTTAWVHQSCLLDWIDVKGKGQSLGSPISCPQCHSEYRVHDQWALPKPLLALVGGFNRLQDRILMYSALLGLGISGYGGLFGYGVSAFTASVGPSQSWSLFRRITPMSTEVFVKVFLGMPLITLSVLSATFPSLSWVFPLLPPILYANDVIEWHQWPPHPKLLALALPFALFGYRWMELYIPRMINNGLGFAALPSHAMDVDGEGDITIEQAIQPAPRTDSDESLLIDDDRAIRVSIISTTACLSMPFISSAIGYAIGQYFRMQPFYQMLLGGISILAVRDLFRGLTWYQRTLIRPFRRILPYPHPA